jgi:hypothetical protein
MSAYMEGDQVIPQPAHVSLAHRSKKSPHIPSGMQPRSLMIGAGTKTS